MRLYPQLAEHRSRQVVRDVLVALALVLFAVLAWAVHSAVMSLTAISEGFTDSASGAQETWAGVGDSLSGIPLVGDQIQKTFQDLAAATFGNAAQTGQTVTDAVTLAANVLAFVTFAAPAVVLLVLWVPRRLDRARAWDAAYRVLSAVPAPPAFAGVGGGAGGGGGGPVGAGGASGAELDAGRAAAIGGVSPGTSAVGGAPEDGLPARAHEDRHDTVALPWGTATGAVGVPLGGGAAGPHAGGPLVAFPPDELLALRALCHLPFEDLVAFTPRPFEAFAAGDYAPLVAALYAHEGLIPPGWSTRP
jgi:hypothetical protein